MTLSVVSVTDEQMVTGPSTAHPAIVGCTHGALDGLGGGRTRTVTVSATLS